MQAGHGNDAKLVHMLEADNCFPTFLQDLIYSKGYVQFMVLPENEP